MTQRIDPGLETSAARLADVLLGMCELNQSLVSLADRHVAALRKGDGVEIERVSRERVGVIGQLEALERERERWTRPWREARVATVSGIVSRVSSEVGERLRGVGQRLRSLLETLRERHALIADATRAMGEHLAGVTRAVTQAIATHGGYSRQGKAVAAPVAPTRLDVRS